MVPKIGNPESPLARAYVLLVCLFIVAPLLIVAYASFQKAQHLFFPVEEYSLRWYAEAFLTPKWRDSLWTSLKLATQSSIGATALGVLVGLSLHYHTFRGRELLNTFFLSPLLMPQLILGIALLFFFASLRLSGQYISLLLGHVLIGIPFAVRLVLASLPSVSRNVEEAAMVLGANEVNVLFRVTLPRISTGIKGAMLFTFMTSYNNVLISLFLSIPRETPIPIRIFQHLEFASDPTVAAIGTLFLLFSLALMLVLEKTVGLQLLDAKERA